MVLKGRDRSRLDGRLTGQIKLVLKGLHIQIVQPAQTVDPAQLQCFKEKEQSRGSTHAPSSSVHTKYTSAIEKYIRKVADHEGNHIHLYSSSANTFLVHHKHMQSSAILKLAHFSTHMYTSMHGCPQAHTHDAGSYLLPQCLAFV